PFVTSGLQENREKSLITEKWYEMEGKILLITNRKSVIAFQNPGLYLACDATSQTKLRFVTTSLPQNHEKLLITQKRYEMEQKLLLITNIQSVISFKEPGLYFACGATWRKKTAFHPIRFTTKSRKSLVTQKRYEMKQKLLFTLL